MTVRRLVVVLVALATAIGIGAMGRTATESAAPRFATLGQPSMPFVPAGSFVTSSWFCPGVPNGGAGFGGSVIVTNPGDAPLTGRITVFSNAAGTAAAALDFSVPGRGQRDIAPSSLVRTGDFLSAMVEIDGGGGVVEQLALHPAGRSVAPCSNATSSNWYFAEGFTVGGSTEQLVLTNPYPDTSTVSIGFSTGEGERRPPAFKSFPIPAQSVRVVDLNNIAFRNEPRVAMQVNVTRGRVVAGRMQHFVGGGRLGASMTLGVPSLTDQVYFADGQTGGNALAERYSVYNPTEEPITVTAVVLGLPASAGFANDAAFEVPATSVTTFEPATVSGLPPGRHAIAFSTESTGSMVVERALVRSTTSSTAGNGVATLVAGAPGTSASSRWTMGIGSDVAVPDGLIVLNVDGAGGTVTVKALGPGGEIAVPSLDGVPIGAGAVLAIPLTDPAVLGRSLVVESDRRVFVERSIARDPAGAGRTGSFALPG